MTEIKKEEGQIPDYPKQVFTPDYLQGNAADIEECYLNTGFVEDLEDKGWVKNVISSPNRKSMERQKISSGPASIDADGVIYFISEIQALADTQKK